MRTPSTVAAFRCFSIAIPKEPFAMHSSRENSRKRKNDSDKRGEYRKFDKASSQMRDTLIESCAERLIAHAAGNGGSCRQGFVK